MTVPAITKQRTAVRKQAKSNKGGDSFLDTTPSFSGNDGF